ncbi:MAG: helix-turn-helix domain-containing protein [Mesorhizobium sp.]|uniref:helix-turn-helix domain-containing protein n=1 Tax=Mesorhizobium sp. TaxID=1871066 RepID=UPI0012189862|nr:helix-turn-helix transcriptional regulator [Mesorhizobium sp.]TIN98301.1 MAG: helix-turn-helix domain-containing protein [Mesorhizobium sp.]
MSDINQITGRQLAAARALTGLDQTDLAKLANVSAPTLRRMEATKENGVAMSNNVAAVIRALEAAGVEFINHSGVRLRV